VQKFFEDRLAESKVNQPTDRATAFLVLKATVVPPPTLRPIPLFLFNTPHCIRWYFLEARFPYNGEDHSPPCMRVCQGASSLVTYPHPNLSGAKRLMFWCGTISSECASQDSRGISASRYRQVRLQTLYTAVHNKPTFRHVKAKESCLAPTNPTLAKCIAALVQDGSASVAECYARKRRQVFCEMQTGNCRTQSIVPSKAGMHTPLPTHRQTHTHMCVRAHVRTEKW
jgi:hypothetical protein